MASWDDISNSFKATLYERSKAPFYGTFLITWILYNWKIWYLLFFASDLSTYETIHLINEHYIEYIYFGNIIIGWGNLYYPILISIFVFVFGTLFNMGFLWLKYGFSNYSRKNIERKNLLDEEKSSELLNQVYLKEMDVDNRIKDKNLELDKVKNEYSDFKKKITFPIEELPDLIRAKDDLKAAKSEITKLQQRINETNNAIRDTIFRPLKKINFLNVIDVFKSGWTDNPANRGRMVRALRIEDDSIHSRILTLSSELSYSLDYIFTSNSDLRQINYVRFIIRGTGDFHFYIKLKCVDDTKDYWFRIHQGNAAPEVNDQWKGREFFVYEMPIKTEGNWLEYFINIDDFFSNTFGKEDKKLQSIDGIRLRGNLQLAEVSFFNLPDNYASINKALN